MDEHPVHLAASKGQLQELDNLFRKHKYDPNTKDSTNVTALHKAAALGHRDVVHCLITHGADVNSLDSAHGNTPLHEAAWQGYSQTVELLCKAKADCCLRNKADFTALHLAAQNGHNQCARILLYAGCETDAKNRYGDTALHTAARYGHVGITRILLTARANVTELNKNDDTPLHIAAALRRRRIARLLIEGMSRCARDVLSLKNAQNETPFEVAFRKGHSSILPLLESEQSKLPNERKNYVKSTQQQQQQQQQGAKLRRTGPQQLVADAAEPCRDGRNFAPLLVKSSSNHLIAAENTTTRNADFPGHRVRKKKEKAVKQPPPPLDEAMTNSGSNWATNNNNNTRHRKQFSSPVIKVNGQEENVMRKEGGGGGENAIKIPVTTGAEVSLPNQAGREKWMPGRNAMIAPSVPARWGQAMTSSQTISTWACDPRATRQFQTRAVEQLSTGQFQLFRDLAGNIRQGPIGFPAACSCLSRQTALASTNVGSNIHLEGSQRMMLPPRRCTDHEFGENHGLLTTNNINNSTIVSLRSQRMPRSGLTRPGCEYSAPAYLISGIIRSRSDESMTISEHRSKQQLKSAAPVRINLPRLGKPRNASNHNTPEASSKTPMSTQLLDKL